MVVVGTPEGVRKVNCIRRLPAIQSADRELVLSIKGYPWAHTEGAEDQEPGEMPTMEATEPIVAEEDLPPKLPGTRAAEALPRKVYIRREVELKKYGFTLKGCKGCQAASGNLVPAPHSDACRARIEQAMQDDPEVQHRMAAVAMARNELGEPVRVESGPQTLPAGATLGEEVQEEVRSAPPSEAQRSAPRAAVRSAPPADVVRSAPPTAEERSAPPAKRVRIDDGNVRSAPPLPEFDDDGDLQMSDDAVGEIVKELSFLGAVLGPTLKNYEYQKEVNFVGAGGGKSQGKAGGDSEHYTDAIVSEIFCKDRITSMTRKFGLHPGYALDLSTGWDLDEPSQVVKAFETQDATNPHLLVGSPQCAPWSQLRFLAGVRRLGMLD
jgi:hypothetical protein